MPTTSHPNPGNRTCCTEFSRAGMSRRTLLKALGTGAAMTAFGSGASAVARSTSFRADAPADGGVMVVISLRGGIDGLSLVVPHAEPAYARLRPSIKIPRSSLVAADAAFGLHPAMQPLAWAWNAGLLAAVNACGLTTPNRSHFAAMEQIEDADLGSRERTGWINRLIGSDADSPALEAVQFGNASMPTALTGPHPTLATNRMSDLQLAGANPRWDPDVAIARRKQHLHTSFDAAPGLLGEAARNTLALVDEVAPLARAEYVPENGAQYPTGPDVQGLSDALADSAHLIKARVGAEVIALDYGDWDLHADAGTVDAGPMSRQLRGFASALSAFLTDLGEATSRVTVVTVSEFGRRVAQNASNGTDHGWGNVMLLAGGGIAGGRYHGTWPGLDNLTDGDLSVTTDYRNVLAEVASHRTGKAPTTAFPGLTYRPVGVTTA